MAAQKFYSEGYEGRSAAGDTQNLLRVTEQQGAQISALLQDLHLDDKRGSHQALWKQLVADSEPDAAVFEYILQDICRDYGLSIESSHFQNLVRQLPITLKSAEILEKKRKEGVSNAKDAPDFKKLLQECKIEQEKLISVLQEIQKAQSAEIAQVQRQTTDKVRKIRVLKAEDMKTLDVGILSSEIQEAVEQADAEQLISLAEQYQPLLGDPKISKKLKSLLHDACVLWGRKMINLESSDVGLIKANMERYYHGFQLLRASDLFVKEYQLQAILAKVQQTFELKLFHDAEAYSKQIIASLNTMGGLQDEKQTSNYVSLVRGQAAKLLRMYQLAQSVHFFTLPVEKQKKYPLVEDYILARRDAILEQIHAFPDSLQTKLLPATTILVEQWAQLPTQAIPAPDQHSISLPSETVDIPEEQWAPDVKTQPVSDTASHPPADDATRPYDSKELKFALQTLQIGPKTYEIQKKIAEGGFGIAFEAQDEQGEKFVIKKMHPPESKKGKKDLRMFIQNIHNIRIAKHFSQSETGLKGDERFVKIIDIVVRDSETGAIIDLDQIIGLWLYIETEGGVGTIDAKKYPEAAQFWQYLQDKAEVIEIMNYLEGEDMKQYMEKSIQKTHLICKDIALSDLLNGKKTMESLLPYQRGEYLELLEIQRDTLQIFFQLADAIAKMEGLNIIHRDIKPENIKIKQSGSKSSVGILDMDAILSTLPEAEKKKQGIPSHVFFENQVLGTPVYMAEESLGNKNLKNNLFERTDTVALLRMMHQYLSGGLQPASEGVGHVSALLMKIIRHDYKRPKERQDERFGPNSYYYFPPVEAIVAKCLWIDTVEKQAWQERLKQWDIESRSIKDKDEYNQEWAKVLKEQQREKQGQLEPAKFDAQIIGEMFQLCAIAFEAILQAEKAGVQLFPPKLNHELLKGYWDMPLITKEYWEGDQQKGKATRSEQTVEYIQKKLKRIVKAYQKAIQSNKLAPSAFMDMEQMRQMLGAEDGPFTRKLKTIKQDENHNGNGQAA